MIVQTVSQTMSMNARSRMVRILFAAFMSPAANACTPVQSIDIFFAKNSATVSADQVLRLAQWTAQLRVRYPNRELLSMRANVEQGERGGEALGRLREQAVVHLIGDLQFSARQVEIAEKIHVLPAGALGRWDQAPGMMSSASRWIFCPRARMSAHVNASDPSAPAHRIMSWLRATGLRPSLAGARGTIGLSLLLATSMALACRPGDLEHEIHLSPGGSTLEVVQIRSLVEWYSIWKTGVNASLGVDYLWIFVKAEKGNARSLHLAQARASNIVRLLDQGDPES